MLDIEDDDKNLSVASMRAMAKYIRQSMKTINDICEQMIGHVEAEEHNANIPPEEDGEQNV